MSSELEGRKKEGRGGRSERERRGGEGRNGGGRSLINHVAYQESIKI